VVARNRQAVPKVALTKKTTLPLVERRRATIDRKGTKRTPPYRYPWNPPGTSRPSNNDSYGKSEKKKMEKTRLTNSEGGGGKGNTNGPGPRSDGEIRRGPRFGQVVLENEKKDWKTQTPGSKKKKKGGAKKGGKIS